ncbi:hypothetical protein M0805_007445 [Coniferiporia weirii]|nr:hypothetical protein M0805_007445 [Coniferiporia weirii]
MPFRARNTYYLRISANDVVPLYLYLDDRHLNWMSERTLQSVISDLRPLIGTKLEAEKYAHYGPGGSASAKKGTVEVHRGDYYQFAYFLRKAEPHTVVLKTRNYVMLQRPTQPVVQPQKGLQGKRKHGESPSGSQDQSLRNKKRAKRPRSNTSTAKPKHVKGKGSIEIIDDSEEDAESSLSDLGSGPEEGSGQHAQAEGPLRRSSRKRAKASRYQEESDDDGSIMDTNQDEDAEMQAREDSELPAVKLEEAPDSAVLQDTENDDPERSPVNSPVIDVDEEEEEKKKLSLQLAFRGLHMRDRCLCVVVEPWPHLPVTTGGTSTAASETFRAASATPSSRWPSRTPSVAPSQFASSSSFQRERGQTPLPLFLPDSDERERSVTPAPTRFPSVFSSLNTMDETQEGVEDDDGFGMVAFSQVLKNVAGDRLGGVDDDDEMDGSVLYGDADEMRDIIQ